MRQRAGVTSPASASEVPTRHERAVRRLVRPHSTCGWICLVVVSQCLLYALHMRVLASLSAPQRARSGPPPQKVRLRVGGAVIGRLRDRTSCVNLDWWPNDKCDHGDCPWANASLLNLDLSDPLVLSATRALAPFTLRLGGSLADQVRYVGVPGEPSEPCAPFVHDMGRRLGFRGGCLRWKRWVALLDFCESVGCELFFSINALDGRRREECPADTQCRLLKRDTRPACCTSWLGAWDMSNTRALLAATARSGRTLGGVSYGNELAGYHGIEAKFEPEPFAAEVLQLSALLHELWPERTPLLLSPNANFDRAWYATFLAAIFAQPPPPPPPPPPRAVSAAAALPPPPPPPPGAVRTPSVDDQLRRDSQFQQRPRAATISGSAPAPVPYAFPGAGDSPNRMTDAAYLAGRGMTAPAAVVSPQSAGKQSRKSMFGSLGGSSSSAGAAAGALSAVRRRASSIGRIGIQSVSGGMGSPSRGGGSRPASSAAGSYA